MADILSFWTALEIVQKLKRGALRHGFAIDNRHMRDVDLTDRTFDFVCFLLVVDEAEVALQVIAGEQPIHQVTAAFI